MHGHNVRPRLLQTPDATLTSVRRTIVDDPEYPLSAHIRFLAHNLFYETVEGFDTGLGFASSEDLSMPDIPGRHVGQRSPTLILKLDAHGFSARGWYDSVLATS